jgi:hypothetical protein
VSAIPDPETFMASTELSAPAETRRQMNIKDMIESVLDDLGIGDRGQRRVDIADTSIRRAAAIACELHLRDLRREYPNGMSVRTAPAPHESLRRAS